MLKKTALTLILSVALSACASDKPRIVQATANMDQVRLTSGMATQIEMPNSGRVQSVVTGNPSLVTADHVDNIVNLVPKEGAGETNLIVRAVDDSGDSTVYQYRIIVQGQ
jgi:hypothetical protein